MAASAVHVSEAIPFGACPYRCNAWIRNLTAYSLTFLFRIKPVCVIVRRMGIDFASSWWLFVLVGLVAGALSGSLGVGSGIIVVPALVLLLACPQKSAQGMALALMVPMAALGVFQYARTPGVVLQGWPIALLIAGAAIGVLAGTKIMSRVPDAWLQRAFAVFLLVVAMRMLWTGAAKRPAAGPRVAAAEVTAGNKAKQD